MRKIAIITLAATLILFAGKAFLFEGKEKESIALKDPSEKEFLEDASKNEDWSGILDVGVMKLTLVLHIEKDVMGKLAAKIDCVEQKIEGCPVESFSYDGKSMQFEIKSLLARFEGVIGEGGEISGNFTQGQATLPLTFKRGAAEKVSYSRPQEPKLPYPYLEEEVAYPNEKVQITIAGTLTLPQGNGPFPAVLLIAGSGPMDRDETIVGHKPFLVLADHLTRQGIAVLRVDKRGVGKSTGIYEAATSRDFADDVIAGIQYLKGRNDIHPGKIGLIGHSEGGIVAPMAALQTDVSFLVLLASPAVNGEEVLYAQAKIMQQMSGVPEEVRALDAKLRALFFDILKKETDPATAENLLKKSVGEVLGQLSEEQRSALNDNNGIYVLNEKNIEKVMQLANTPWIRFFLTYDPSSALKKTTTPVLAINGELDIQVLPHQNMPVIESALMEAGNKEYSIIELPGINHLFQTCKTGALEEYQAIEETISPKVLNIVSDWVLEKVESK